MRAARAASSIVFTVALLTGTAVAAGTPVYDVEELGPMQAVAGWVALDTPSDLGAFSVSDRVYQHRNVPRSGAPLTMNDPRLTGHIESTWNWDVHSSGTMPVPAWGTMRIEVPALATLTLGGEDGATVDIGLDQGAWSGDFTGIRSTDGEPFRVRAFLFGEGAYEGLCATLDIEAGDMAWSANGIIHPVDMIG